MTETALPPTVTGTSTGATTWLPPATLSVPSVVAPGVSSTYTGMVCNSGAASGAGSGAASGAGVEVSASSLWLSPITETALPPTVTGTSIEMMPWFPEATPSLPSVVATGAASGAGAEVSASSLWLSPMSETALPPTVTGRSTEIAAWSPESRPSAPEVSAALAMPHPRTAKPPPTSAPSRARE